MLSEPETREVLDIIVKGKGVIPYEKINSIDSLNSKPENGLFFLKILLTMRDLYDLNDFYNAQEVLLLLEIRYQTMQDKTMFNSRKCSSGSKLSSCIQCE